MSDELNITYICFKCEMDKRSDKVYHIRTNTPEFDGFYICSDCVEKWKKHEFWVKDKTMIKGQLNRIEDLVNHLVKQLLR